MRLIIFLILIGLNTQAQDSIIQRKHYVFVEPTYGLQVLNFTERVSGGSSTPSLLFFTQVQLALNINVLYRNKFVNGGFGFNMLQVGSKVSNSGREQIYGLYDAYFRLGYNFMSIVKKKESDFRIGPFATFGRVRPTLTTFHMRNNCSFGIEMYKRNFRLAASIGFFKISDGEKEIQNLQTEYYRSNHLFALNIGWSLPRKYPKQRTL